jgi:hypothetical protein
MQTLNSYEPDFVTGDIVLLSSGSYIFSFDKKESQPYYAVKGQKVNQQTFGMIIAREDNGVFYVLLCNESLFSVHSSYLNKIDT